MNYFRLLGVFLRVSILNELAYRANFAMQLLQSAISLATGLLGISIVFSHTTTLNGWRQAELLALLGVYQLVGGFINLIIQPSLNRFMTDVRQGTLDYTLTKPEDAQLLVSVREVQVWKLVDIIIGLTVLGVALVLMGNDLGVWQALSFGLMMLTGGAIIYSFWLMLGTCCFWLVRMDNILVIFQQMYQAGRWPVGIYPVWLRWALTFLVPVAFVTTVPVEAIAGRLGVDTLLLAVGLAVGFLVVSRWFWLFGLRHYSGASA